MADGDGRHRDGRQSPRREAWRTRARRSDDRARSIWARSPSGTIRRSRSSIRSSICPISRSPISIAPTARAPLSTSPTISSEVSPDWKDKVGSATTVEWPARHRRQGQRRRRQQRRHHRRRDRLCRIRLRRAEQADLRQHDQQGGQDGRADHGGLPGRSRQRRLGQRAGLLSDPGQSAGRQVVADDRRDVHSHVQEAGQCGRLERRTASSSGGLTTKGDKMAQDLDYIPMPDNVVALVEKMWDDRRPAEVIALGKRRGAPSSAPLSRSTPRGTRS